MEYPLESEIPTNFVDGEEIVPDEYPLDSEFPFNTVREVRVPVVSPEDVPSPEREIWEDIVPIASPIDSEFPRNVMIVMREMVPDEAPEDSDDPEREEKDERVPEYSPDDSEDPLKLIDPPPPYGVNSKRVFINTPDTKDYKEQRPPPIPLIAHSIHSRRRGK